ncbi:cytochrome c [bacterium]|nr:cytochrome c [bacterium]
MHRFTKGLFLLLGLLFSGVVEAYAVQPTDYFRQNCASCHTIGGGRLTGPDLKNVSERRDHSWLVNFIRDPQAVINSGDSYAKQMVEESRGVIMPTLPGMSAEIAEQLLSLIKIESALEESQFRGLQMPDAPFTEIDIARGRALFRGELALVNNGPSCVGCHTTGGLGGLGGGRLGPELTKVYERIQGRKGLAAWLVSPPTVTMKSIFSEKQLQQDEILALVAFFENEAQTDLASTNAPPFSFFLLGLLLSVFILALFDLIWKRRFRNVRRKQVQDAAKEVLHGS